MLLCTFLDTYRFSDFRSNSNAKTGCSPVSGSAQNAAAPGRNHNGQVPTALLSPMIWSGLHQPLVNLFAEKVNYFCLADTRVTNKLFNLSLYSVHQPSVSSSLEVRQPNGSDFGLH